MRIGDVEISGPVVLAPMAGVTTLAYREFMKPFGAALSYSEMISDCGLSYGNAKTMGYIKTSKLDRPVGLQLFGSDIAHTKKAIKILEENADYDILDFNLGCPVYKVVKTGAGSAWLRKPQELYEYMREAVRASHKPVTAKIRLGWDENSINVYEVASLLEEAGVSALFVHARTSRQGYSGQADFSKMKDMKSHISIPFGVSGDIYSPEDAKKAMDTTGASFVMVARGGVGHPNLVRDINSYLKDGTKGPTPTLMDEVGWAEDFSERLISYEGERTAVAELRGLLPHFFSGFPGYKRIRVAISSNIKTADDVRNILRSIKEREHL
jgi:nifR3 family TIM-barrel protein